jgi:ATP/maltotriose-dependent transcriptional regulator MalT
MTIVLLKTKLAVPSVRSRQVARPRLIERLDAGLERKLILVSAPAGYGKTTLISAWVKTRGLPTAWFSIEQKDNQPESFWFYVIAALQSIGGRVGEDSLSMLLASPPSSLEAILSTLLNELGEIRQDFILVLDDFHIITNRQIQDGVMFLVEHLPWTAHVILSTRADPPWLLARLRSKGEMAELRVDHLRFTIGETAEFMNDVMGLSLDPEDIIALDTRTEGWIAGLQMSALSIEGRVDKSGFIEALSGSHRFILDYLVEEVLNRQPADIQQFLSRTSLLGCLNASLCNAVTDRADSQKVLRKLERANLFLIPLDDERCWYRYHPLFAELLNFSLSQKWPEEIPRIHRRASEWYMTNGLIADAVDHATAIGDVDYVVRLIEMNAITVIAVYNHQLLPLVNWLNDLPEHFLHSRPRLLLTQAWALAYSGKMEHAEAVIQKLEQILNRDLPEAAGKSADREQWDGYIASIRGYNAFMRGDTLDSYHQLSNALKQIPDSDIPTRVFTAVSLGAAIGLTGDLDGGIQLLTEAVELYQDHENPFLTLVIMIELLGLQVLQGKLRQVIATSKEVIRLSSKYSRLTGQLPSTLGFAYARLSYALREQNQIELAIFYAQEAVKISRKWGQKDSMGMSYLYLAYALQAAGRSAKASEAIERARQTSKDISHASDAIVSAYEVKLHYLQGDLAFITNWAEACGLGVEDHLPFSRVREYLTFARALMVQEKLEESNSLLQRLLPLSTDAGAISYVVENLVLQALVLQEQGKDELALDRLEQALELAELEGFVRSFVDEGERIIRLLRMAAARKYRSEYAIKLLAILESLSDPGPKSSSGVLGNLLTLREVEILKMLSTGMTVPQIADELCIAVSTLRTHIRNIYEKLGVHSRIEAAAIAQEMIHL